ncbi:hypothetical protein OS242_01420 [Tumebacillus sp. DT12]|uniref:Phage phiEco32-like COOH-NH2 ligase-type 2 n=1 Tax=Tumebacillus lacus TaxID=2995335 RepID=A0ABT3WY62_9BACL|nr:hypothetical protein [Tumebacillus lacus]MCX7568628.1 hypothetical protein [Tumebacillus lacus]
MGYWLLHSGQPSAKRLLKRVEECTGVEHVNPVASQDVVIRWGNVQGSDSRAAWTLNPRQAIVNTSNRTRMLRILKLNGVYAPLSTSDLSSELADYVTLDSGKRVKVMRHYRVPLFDLQPLALFRADSKSVWLKQGMGRAQDRFKEVPFDEDVYAERAVRLALRSLHALGLDFGVVNIGITARDRTICLNVNPAPVLQGRMLDLYEDALQAFITRDRAEERVWDADGRNNRPFLMGTDLEFMLRSPRGKMVLASKFLPRKGRVGCDDRSINLDQKRFPLAELRPDPARTPEDLVANIRETLTEAQRLITSRELQWLAGSMPFPNYSLGGHVHFSDLAFSSRLVKALDNYLGFPVLMIEASSTAVKRRPKYGFLGDVRFKSHGGFEYRTPGSWLITPEITHAVLALAYVVAVHYRDLSLDIFSNPRKQRMFYTCDKLGLMADFRRVWREVEDTSTYRRYQGVLRVIPEMVEQGIAWNEGVDIKRSWGLPQETARRSSGAQPAVKANRKKVRRNRQAR